VTSTKSAAPHRGLTAVIWWTMVSPGASLTPSCDLDWTWMTWRHAPETFKFDGFYHLVMTNLT
jgi:aminoglycoside phosphotransferase (APT) family kinase protein